MPDLLTQWYGEERLARDEAIARRFWAGEGRAVATLMLWPFPYRQSFDDETMLTAAPQHLQATAGLPGLGAPCFHADFGTISTARYWGGETEFGQGSNIHLKPVARNLEQALALVPAAVDDPQHDAAHALRLYHQLRERLETDKLWLRTPDFQGVLTTAGLIVEQTELLMGLVADPDLAHQFLDRVCDFLISYGQYLKRETGGRVCGNIWPDTFLPCDVGMSFTEDFMPLLSPDTYREYALPVLRRLQDAFGGLHIHCCGEYGRHAATLADESLNVLALESHHPLTKLEELEPLAPRTVFIPFLNGWVRGGFATTLEFFEHLLNNTPEHYRYWFIVSEDTPEAREFVTRVMNEYAPG